MFGKLNSTEIEEVLTHQIIGRIACHANDMSYIVPISYAYDGECVYARTYEGLKIHLMRKNPNVCFQTDIMENMANWKSVIAWGEFKELTETSERNEGIQKLLARKISGIASETVKLSPVWPFASNEYSEEIDGIIFCIRLGEKTGRFESSNYHGVFS
jgi:nitroimidazol reductase NimA-like FMN-containing flavoprotein (pyridoxamine 5'-phosphate oxidase superfamily)